MSSWLSEREQRLVAGAEAISAATPIPTQIVSNGEYLPPPQSETQKRVEQQLDPFVPVLDTGGITSVELPSVEKRLDQRLQRLGSGLQGEETPASALLKSLRP